MTMKQELVRLGANNFSVTDTTVETLEYEEAMGEVLLEIMEKEHEAAQEKRSTRASSNSESGEEDEDSGTGPRREPIPTSTAWT